ncbi:MAG: glycosyl transferase [Acidimicrobiaceae bacterium]|nr:glycosyl transferase [Acidimicrobiaceae bacterium]
MPTVTVVVLTMGDRPTELAAAIESARRQSVDVEIVLVINGGDPDRSLADIVVDPGENLGIPEGRNCGAAAGTGTLICFLDDDGALRGDVFGPAVEAFAASNQLGVIGLRVVDEHGKTARRHLPGLRKDAERSAPATAFAGGACLLRRSAFDEVKGLCGPFRYGLEETDLSWRMISDGWDVQYRSDLQIYHPRTSPARHPEFFFHTARNRVWLAHRLLPLPIGLVYVFNWTAITLAKNFLAPASILSHLRGTIAGFRSRPGPRNPISWTAVMELTRRGRPPLV